jgi:hypothetical protein
MRRTPWRPHTFLTSFAPPQVIVGSMFWDRNLPFAVEAFFYSAAAPQGKDRLHRTHRNFLDYYGLSAEEVPLLEYSCSQQDADTNRRNRQHRCWKDVS